MGDVIQRTQSSSLCMALEPTAGGANHGNSKEIQLQSRILWVGYPPVTRMDKQMLHNAMILFGEIEGIQCFPVKHYSIVEFRSVDEARRAKEGLQGRLFNDPRIQILFSTGGGDVVTPPTPPSILFPPRCRPSPQSPPDVFFPPRRQPSPSPNLVYPTRRPPPPLPDLVFPPRRPPQPPHDLVHSPRLPPLPPSDLVFPPRRPPPPPPSNIVFPLRRTPPSSDLVSTSHDPPPPSDRGFPSRSPPPLPDLPFPRSPPPPPTADLVFRPRQPPPPSMPNLVFPCLQSPPSPTDSLHPVPEEDSSREGKRMRMDVPSNDGGNIGPAEVANGAQEPGPGAMEDVWRGVIAKGGTPVCCARCVPIGKGIKSPFPEVVNCTAKTGLEPLLKHCADAKGLAMMVFLPDGENDFSSYTDFLHYLSHHHRAAVARLADGASLFLVPPSPLLPLPLNLISPNSLYGFVLDLPSPPMPKKSSHAPATSAAPTGQQTKQQEQRPALTSLSMVGPATESEAEKRQRYQSTLQVAAALLHQIKHQQDPETAG